MPRPCRQRTIRFSPDAVLFKPAGIPASALATVTISLDELEGLRLVNLENMTQEQAATAMDISQPTLHRILASARRKITDALVNGKAMSIQGGMTTLTECGPKGAGLRRQGRHQGRRNGRINSRSNPER
ncbi:hypothetical protein AUJ68_01960 [Candidatus Woesearchaeota archaeon CG1_02_57_44]|nr:MAG: hypothetical protein AUJ68_01960 [Candidatus Woesearchaeota archaeon CG1_02_57_44]